MELLGCFIYIYIYLFFEFAIQKGCFYIHLMNLIIIFFSNRILLGLNFTTSEKVLVQMILGTLELPFATKQALQFI
jgi:hypothetical protein